MKECDTLKSNERESSLSVQNVQEAADLPEMDGTAGDVQEGVTESVSVPELLEESAAEASDMQEEIRKDPKEVGKSQEAGKKSRFGFLKAAVNAAVILLNGFIIALIVCLFLAQPDSGEWVKPTIQKFDANSDEYYSEEETYEQINANVHVYQSEGRPDGKENE